MGNEKNALNPDVLKSGLKYYIFDWDDNILHMPTEIILERKTDDGNWEKHHVPTSTFALIRNDTENYRPPEGDWEKAFVNFRDLQKLSESAFLIDTKKALQPVIDGEEKGAPSFYKLKKALIEGRIIGIVTARGHEPQSIRSGVEYFIEQILDEDEKAKMLKNLRSYLQIFEDRGISESDEEVLDYYLSLNKYHGVTSPAFSELLGEGTPGSENPEVAKQVAIKDFVDHVISLIRGRGINKPVSIGFSDDDMGNVKAVEEYIEQQLVKEFPNIKFVIYDTSDPEVPKGRKIILQGQLELEL